MKVSELVVRLIAKGAEDTKRDIKSVNEELKKTKKETAENKSLLDEFSVGGMKLSEVLQNITTGLSGLSPAMAFVGGSAVGATLAVVAFTGALVGLSAESYKMLWNARSAGVEFEAMKARLEGLTGSAKRANELLALAAKEAGPSMFTTQQIEKAMVNLTAFGQNVERVLPLITKLGQGMGANDEKMMQYVRGFNMLKQGMLPEAETLGAMGLSKSMLAKRGIKFDNQGTLLSSAESTMVAVEKIINEKFSGAIEKSKYTTQALEASMADSLEMINRYFGYVTNEGIRPFEQAIADVLSQIAGSQFPELFATQLMAPLKELTGIGGDLKEVFMDVTAVLAAMANVIPRNLTYLIKEWNSVSKDQTFMGSLQRIGSRSATLLTAIPRLFDPTGKTTGETGSVEADALAFRASMELKRASGKVNDKKKDDPFGAEDRMKPADTKDHAKKTRDHLRKIESNTRKTSDLLDLRRSTLGGGAIGSLGVTGAELAGMGMRVRSEITKVKPLRGDTMVNRGIKDIIRNNTLFSVNGGQGMPVR